jgi:YHS domain-containing protein
MNRILFSAAFLILAIGCSPNSPPPSQTPPPPTATAAPPTQAASTLKPINRYCAVERDNEVDPSVTYLYQGKLIGFCCEDCIPKFKADPEKYMKGLK